jgi:ribosomal protein S2
VECANLGIPTTSVVSSNTWFFELLTYPIMGNNQAIHNIFFYIILLHRAVLEGRKKEYLRVLAII